MIRALKMTCLLLLIMMLSVLNVFASKDKNKKKKQETKPLTTQVPTINPTPAPIPGNEARTENLHRAPERANGSLFSESAAGNSLFSDFKPRNVGDLVFIDVIESSSANVVSGAKRSRDTGTIGGLATAVGALPSPSAATAGGVLTALGTRKYEGDGSTQRNSSVTARIAARVVEVLPNGDLRVVAMKVVRINREDEQLKLSGIVRTRDVSADNSVPTTSVGNLFVELNGKGVASADNAPGWLFRLFDKVAPF